MSIAVFLTVLFGLPLALLALAVWAGVKIVRAKGFVALAATFAAIVLAVTAIWHVTERRFALDFVPDALEVSSILYDAHEHWGAGIGGGDAETVLRVFPLGASVAQRIQKQGVRYFETMPADADAASGSRWRNGYFEWRETPMYANIVAGDHGDVQPLTVAAFLNQYGWGIDIDGGIEKRVNAILQSPGSFYGMGRVGMLVVSPRERLVVFMFAK